MTKSRLPLTLSTWVLLGGCNQVTSMLTMGGEEKAPDAVKTAPTDTSATPVAPVAGTPTAVAAPVPTGPATVDDLLGLAHEGSTTYVLFKTPDSLLGVAETTASTFEGPLTALVNSTQPDKLAELAQGFTLFKSGVADVRAALVQAGTDLGRGVVLTSNKPDGDDPVVIFSANGADGAKALITALKIPDAATVVCAPAVARPGYVACAKDQATLDGYKPGDAKAARDRLNAALPAVAVDELAVLGHVSEGDIHFGVGQPAGGFAVHVSAPPDAKDLFSTLAPGKADLLRFAPAGTGFLWMKLDLDELKKKGMNEVPLPFAATVGAFTGEILFGGSADPAALQARFSFSDTTSLTPLADLAVMFGGPYLHNKPIPDVPGSKVTFKAENVSVGTEKVKALHFGLSGVPQAKTLADQLGLDLDAWMFPAEGTLAAVVGVDAKDVGNVKGAATSDATVAALPPALAASLRAGEVGFVAHIPLDGFQSPELGKLLDGSLAKLPGYNPTAARSGLGMVAPLSSTTMWVTEHQNTGVIHFAIQTIGNTTDEEGKAALAAAASADPAKAFGELATKYPSSPRLAAYQTRAGVGGAGALIGSSGPALLLAGGAIAALFRGTQEAPPDGAVMVADIIPAPVPVPVDPPKVDPPKPKADPPKPKADPPKTTPTKADPPKADPPKADPPKADPPKADPPKIDPIKGEPAKPPVPRPTEPAKPPPIRVGRDGK